MQKTEITAEVVAEAEHRLSDGVSPRTIAKKLGITPYVIAILIHNRHLLLHPRKVRPRSTRKTQERYDATTIRMVERMLEVGILPQIQIAREAGVSPKTVSDVACGRRQAVTTEKPVLCVGERFMRRPVRCPRCGARISVTPCRACRTKSEKCFAWVSFRA